MIAWFAQSALATSILVVVVLVLRRPVAAAFGARAAYALWLAPALRAALPPISLPAASLPAGAPIGVAADFIVVSQPASPATLPFIEVAAAVWIGGALAYLALHWWRHERFLSDALAHGRPLHLADVPYDVVASSRVDGPLATGLIHPLILVPEDFEDRFTVSQQRLALLHEQSHHRRGDIWASLAAMLVTAFLWFNPLAHMALRAFRRDMEAACDARVIAETGTDAATPYAETILRSVARPAPRSLCALTAVDELKGRLMMLSRSHGHVRKKVGLAVAAALTAGGLLLAAPAVADEPKAGETKTFVKRIEINEMKGDKDVIVRGADHDRMAHVLTNCEGEKFETSASGGADNKKEHVKFFVCTRKGESLLAALEKAAARIEKEDEVPAGRKQDILNQLRAKIAELRAKG